MKTYIKIGDNEPFLAGFGQDIGIIHGSLEETKPGDPVKGYTCKTRVYRAHYFEVVNDQVLERDIYYRYGAWELYNDDICFHVWEPLT